MQGTIAPTDFNWYEFLLQASPLEEANFWTPSTYYSFRADPFSPFLFKLGSPHNAVCGFGYFARYSALPDWLAWETFRHANGCSSLGAMRERIDRIRTRIRYRSEGPRNEIGCILIVQPVFFSRNEWVPQP